MKRIGPIVRQAAVVALLLLTSYTGIVDGMDSARSASSLGQQLGAVGQLLYGGLAVASLLALLLSRRWVMPLVIAWGVVLTVTGGLATVVWGEQSAIVGAFAALCTAGIAVLVVWACRRHNADARRRRTEASPAA